MTKKKKSGPGPKPDQLQIEGDWRQAMGKAIKKKKPEEGWPNSEQKPAKKEDEA